MGTDVALTHNRQQRSRTATQSVALLRYALTHSGLVPTAAIAPRSCAVVHRNIAVQYLTSWPSLILTRARSMRPESPKPSPIRHPSRPERSTLDVTRVRSLLTFAAMRRLAQCPSGRGATVTCDSLGLLFSGVTFGEQV